MKLWERIRKHYYNRQTFGINLTIKKESKNFFCLFLLFSIFIYNMFVRNFVKIVSISENENRQEKFKQLKSYRCYLNNQYCVFTYLSITNHEVNRIRKENSNKIM